MIKDGYPINKTAALVTGKEWKENPKRKEYEEDLVKLEPRKQVEIPKASFLNPEFKDLTGVRFGRFTVTGYLGAGRWQVRCDCGRWAKRKAKAVQNKNNSFDCCVECRGLAYKKRTYDYLATGKEKNIENYY